MAWSAPIIHAVGDILSASDWNISSNDLSFLASTTSASIATSQPTNSTSFTDLATVGPVVSLTTGANALVFCTANLRNDSGTGTGGAAMNYAVSGATTIAAPAGPTNLFFMSAIANQQATLTCAVPITGLTPGTNVFTAKYEAVTTGNATFVTRVLSVIPLP